MPDYSKISKTLQKLNLSHLEETFKVYGIHDYVVLTLTSSQLRRYLPNNEERFRREFLILCTSDDVASSQETEQEDRSVQDESTTENQLSGQGDPNVQDGSNAGNQFSQSSTQEEMPDVEQVVSDLSYEEKSTQTGSSNGTDREIIGNTQVATTSKSRGMSEKTKVKKLKKSGNYWSKCSWSLSFSGSCCTCGYCGCWFWIRWCCSRVDCGFMASHYGRICGRLKYLRNITKRWCNRSIDSSYCIYWTWWSSRRRCYSVRNYGDFKQKRKERSRNSN
ncbi:uncharacterized protein LOC119075378 isoform X2 [Bradysia coprophila]|uniref:uncharacterized protein LOC119075378 isoform X2 n=1 Tax=Bradysia coprophila TaxID=38358 RepID=UPI00187DBBFA|nr:uncharacterized protein LOC119075378 isoform X2 [Bradysia coprophila]